MKNKFYVTTPIYYVNDNPHIGHTCTTLIADILARYHKFILGEKKVFFLTGTDEHGAKIAEAAKKQKLTPKEFCNQISKNFKNIWPKLNIRYDYFIRTTNPTHKKIVQEIIQKIYQKGDIYKGRYEGYYCVGCEKFITDIDLVNGKCPLHPNMKIQKESEENYFFRLSKYIPQIIEIIENPNDRSHYQIVPQEKKEEVLSRLKQGVTDLSISRANVPWGIPIPWDKEQTIYVWFDALLNYYSALKINRKENFWPPDLHIIAKEILWFHTVIWPAILLSAGISLPKTILVHNFYTIDGQKMSKSLGNIITPEDILAKFDVDGARYLITSSFPLKNDIDIGWEAFIQKYNADLANGLGNLVQRIAVLCEKKKYSSQANFPTKISSRLEKLGYSYNFKEFRFDQVLGTIWQLIKENDLLINEEEPWKKTSKEVQPSLRKLVDGLLEIAYALQPFLPETANKIKEVFTAEKISAPKKPLFPRI